MLCFIPETEADHTGIRAVVTAAFGQPNEAQLIDRIRASDAFIPQLSIVAKLEETVVGHILFSRIYLETPDRSVPAVALAPLAVAPSHQRQGIGSQLINVGLFACRNQEEPVVVVLGHPQYYPRFGFQPAHLSNIQPPFTVPEEAFMVQILRPQSLSSLGGVVRYPDYFYEV